jgi:hypothetical protein
VRTIVVGVDGTERGDDAVVFAQRLADVADARLMPVHAYASSDPLGRAPRAQCTSPRRPRAAPRRPRSLGGGRGGAGQHAAGAAIARGTDHDERRAATHRARRSAARVPLSCRRSFTSSPRRKQRWPSSARTRRSRLSPPRQRRHPLARRWPRGAGGARRRRAPSDRPRNRGRPDRCASRIVGRPIDGPPTVSRRYRRSCRTTPRRRQPYQPGR